jgi:hypothetical protein
VKTYTIQRTRDGLLLTCEELKKGKVIKAVPSGPFDIGNASEKTKALASAVMSHYMGVTPQDFGAIAEAKRRTKPFLDAFLLHHKLPLNGRIVISSDVIDRFFSLYKIPS